MLINKYLLIVKLRIIVSFSFAIEIAYKLTSFVSELFKSA